MHVTLTPEWERYVKEQVDAGRFQSANDVIREGLRLLLERQDLLDGLDEKIGRGMAQAAAGQTYSLDEARSILEARRAARSNLSK